MADQDSALAAVGDVTAHLADDHVGTVEIHRPPNNHFDVDLIDSIAEVINRLDEAGCRAVVLCSEGKHFCAGADFGGPRPDTELPLRHVYDAAYELFSCRLPIVAAVQGAAIGGGLGVACAADFRVAAPSTRFSANFARLGFHHGFGLTVTLPSIVGQQRALELLYTGRRISGDEAHAIGLVDRLVAEEGVRDSARELAAEIAASAPLAVRSIRDTMRGDLPDRIRAATDRERAEQERLQQTDDWREGVRSVAERRPGNFTGR